MISIENVRKFANNLKDIGLVKNWNDFSVRYCQRSPVYLQSVRKTGYISPDVLQNIETHYKKDCSEYGIILSTKLENARNILLA